MKKNILVAPNSFKECANSVEIASLFQTAFDKLLPENLKKILEFHYKPISDGGDGFLEIANNYFSLELLHFEISYPHSDEKFLCPVGYSMQENKVYIESALVLGLNLVPEDNRNPLLLTSKGMGELIEQLIESAENGFLDIKELVIGIGGTATNDMGLGMMSRFGFELFDKDKSKLDVLPANFIKADKVKYDKKKLPFDITIVHDVNNPLLGKEGATMVYALQKGAGEKDLGILEKGLENISDLIGCDEETKMKLNGAGGGLAAAFQLFFDAKLKSAEKFIFEDLGIAENVYDFVLTGEGKFDFQSRYEKGSYLIIKKYAPEGIPVYVVCGEAEGDLPEEENIHIIELAEYFESLEESIEKIDEGILTAAKIIARDILHQFTIKN
ncbi:glycerate kinase [Melioribacter roseus P3M-2]|uniref:Glycerate kinase n=1 Tax=Melioribacter roseus (strain DSM 23840 / JCM 17771 / VKM B-2668 / P3M-2) TaxID=1191523 RepID=I6YZH5_MELRP|nr:glycerate kinase [Melioribacter roseus]AFN75957.1 glycerate kinase [Melioribacter roseus P3M-2]